MDADLRDLVLAWLNGEDPGEERGEALLARLRAEAAFRQAFVEEIRLLGMLKVVQHSGEPRWLRLEEVCGWSRPEPMPAAALADQVVRAAVQRRRRTIMLRALAVAAALVLAIGTVLFFRAGAPPKHSIGSHMELATAIQLEEVDWAEQSDLRPEEGSTVTAGRLHLRGGRVTLAFFSGVLLTVEGPADLELAAMDRLFCHAGKLRLRAPVGAEGFTVQAPGYEVIDLGTEFGLNVAEETSYLRVFQGAAALSLLDARGHSVRSIRVGGGKDFAIDPENARIDVGDPQPDRYVSLPHVLPPKLRLPPSYAADVLVAKPWAYWRFEREQDGRVLNEIAERPGLELREGVRLDGMPGGGNRWAYFRANNPRQALLMDGEWSPPRGSGYAIEMWVQAETVGQSALVSLIDRMEGPENHVALLELTARSQRTPFEPCAVRFLDRWPPGEAGGVDVFSRRTFIPALWHHIVAQKTGAMLELYLDGRLAGSSPALPDSADPDEVTRPCWLLVGRLKQWAPLRLGQIRPFEGRIDELALYERPLSLEEIRRHAKR